MENVSVKERPTAMLYGGATILRESDGACSVVFPSGKGFRAKNEHAAKIAVTSYRRMWPEQFYKGV